MKTLPKVSILGIGVTTASKVEILAWVKKELGIRNQKSLVIVTPNPEQMVRARHDAEFAKLLNAADIAIADGAGIVLAAKIQNLGKRLERITGVELMESLVEMAARERLPVALIGGRRGVGAVAFERLREKYQELEGWTLEPEISHLDNLGKETNKETNMEKTVMEISRKIRESGAGLVFIGLGAPKQEYFISYLKKIKNKNQVIYMAVGGAFDELSGRLARPPKIVERLGLKWLFRLLLEPWRWRRQLALIKFIWLVFRSM